MRSPVAQILNDEQTSKQLEKDDCRLAYYYIRGWAMNRGMFTRKQNRTASYISPSCIVSWITKTSDPIYQGLLSASGQRIDNQSAYLFSKYTFQFFEQFSKEYASIGSPLLSKQPYVEDTAHDWVDLLENLRTLSVEKKLDCPLYLRIDAVITGSSVNGGEWLRKVESRLDVLHAGEIKSRFPLSLSAVLTLHRYSHSYQESCRCPSLGLPCRCCWLSIKRYLRRILHFWSPWPPGCTTGRSH